MSRLRIDAKHDYTLSKTFSSPSKVPESKSARTSILRPLDNTTSKALPLGVSARCLVSTNATGTNRLPSPDSTLPKRRLFKCRCLATAPEQPRNLSRQINPYQSHPMTPAILDEPIRGAVQQRRKSQSQGS